ncbi:hypothetical protein [Bacterioplanoides sp.]|uniref:hypothetical protein n=1 Tax=Bacterioplanoides sp. TaxID=2066072 RepID=UPI003B004E10
MLLACITSAYAESVQSDAAQADVIQADTTKAETIALVSHKPSKAVQRLAEKTAQLSGFNIEPVVLGSSVQWPSYSAVVLAGNGVVERWNQPNIPAVAVFVSQTVVQQAGERLQSAIYLEPPLKRQIELARQVLGPDKSLGILASRNAGNIAGKTASGDSEAKAESDALTQTYFIEDYPDLNRALADLLTSNVALVGAYDPALFSSANIKNILITAYRRNKPLIGPSGSYIKAGALASTYSDLGDVAQRLSEILLQGLGKNDENKADEAKADAGKPDETSAKSWPVADYNPYFNVRYNKQVGRSLNLVLPDIDTVTNHLRQQEVQP